MASNFWKRPMRHWLAAWVWVKLSFLCGGIVPLSAYLVLLCTVIFTAAAFLGKFPQGLLCHKLDLVHEVR
jgi:hypothetical protein